LPWVFQANVSKLQGQATERGQFPTRYGCVDIVRNEGEFGSKLLGAVGTAGHDPV